MFGVEDFHVVGIVAVELPQVVGSFGRGLVNHLLVFQFEVVVSVCGFVVESHQFRFGTHLIGSHLHLIGDGSREVDIVVELVLGVEHKDVGRGGITHILQFGGSFAQGVGSVGRDVEA